MFKELILNYRDAKILTFSEQYQILGIFFTYLYDVEIDL